MKLQNSACRTEAALSSVIRHREKANSLLTKATDVHPAGLCEGQLFEYIPTRTAIIRWDIVIKKLPQRSKGRRPKRSIVHRLVLTPTSFLALVNIVISVAF